MMPRNFPFIHFKRIALEMTRALLRDCLTWAPKGWQTPSSDDGGACSKWPSPGDAMQQHEFSPDVG